MSMSRSRQALTGVALIVALMIGGGLVAAFGRSPASLGGVAAADTPSTDHTISVSGSGQVLVTPDTAQVELGATVQSADLGQAQQTVNQKMNDILAALKASGIPDSQIQTTQFSINVDRDPKNPQGPITGYTVTHLAQVKVKPLDQVGSIIDTAVAKGANVVNDVAFIVGDPNAALQQARQQAMADAKAKAQQLAQLGNVTLGPVVNISEGVNYPPTPQQLDKAQAAAGTAAPAATEIQPGQSSVSVDVTVSYAIQ